MRVLPLMFMHLPSYISLHIVISHTLLGRIRAIRGLQNPTGEPNWLNKEKNHFPQACTCNRLVGYHEFKIVFFVTSPINISFYPHGWCLVCPPRGFVCPLHGCVLQALASLEVNCRSPVGLGSSIYNMIL